MCVYVCVCVCACVIINCVAIIILLSRESWAFIASRALADFDGPKDSRVCMVGGDSMCL